MNRTAKRTVGTLILLTLLCLAFVIIASNAPAALAQPNPDPSAACQQTCVQNASVQPVACEVAASGAPVLATQVPEGKAVKGGEGKSYEENLSTGLVTSAPNPPASIVTPAPAKDKEPGKGGDQNNDDDKKCPKQHNCSKDPGGHENGKDGKGHKGGDDHDKGKGHDKHKKGC